MLKRLMKEEYDIAEEKLDKLKDGESLILNILQEDSILESAHILYDRGLYYEVLKGTNSRVSRHCICKNEALENIIVWT